MASETGVTFRHHPRPTTLSAKKYTQLLATSEALWVVFCLCCFRSLVKTKLILTFFLFAKALLTGLKI